MNISSVNIVLVLGAMAGPIPLGTIIKAYAPDTGVSIDATETAEVSKGIDGTFYHGLIPDVPVLTFTLGAGSESIPLFEALKAAEELLGRKIELTGTYIVPATNTAYAIPSCVVSSMASAPTAGTTLQPREISLSCDRLIPAPIPDEALAAVADINSAVG